MPKYSDGVLEIINLVGSANGNREIVICKL